MAEHIFESTDQITDHYPFLSTINFAKLKPSMKFVERRYRPEIMDDDTWAALLGKLDDIGSESQEWQDLINLVRDAFAYLTAAHYIPHGNIGIGEQGLQVATSENFVPASKDRKNDLMRGIHEQAQDHLDLIIAHLNGNAATFTDYAASDLADSSQASLINDAATLSTFYPIGTNRWIWRKLKPWRDTAENTALINTLGKEYHQELIDQAKADTLTDDNKIIYFQAQRALAFHTIELAIMHLSIRIDETGVSIYNNASQPSNDLRTTAEMNRIGSIHMHCNTEATQALRVIEMELQLNASATKYATFFNSSTYVAPADATKLNDTAEDPAPGYFNGL